jgi:hypothetical protein
LSEEGHTAEEVLIFLILIFGALSILYWCECSMELHYNTAKQRALKGARPRIELRPTLWQAAFLVIQHFLMRALKQNCHLKIRFSSKDFSKIYDVMYRAPHGS